MTLGEIAAQAATSGECKLTKFAFTFVSFCGASKRPAVSV